MWTTLRILPAAVIALGAIACAEGTPTSPSPQPPPAVGAPPSVGPNIQRVTVTPSKLSVTGSCDHDSRFESADDGEFQFRLDVERGGVWTTVWSTEQGAYKERDYSIEDRSMTFMRNVTNGEDFLVRFVATEYDGLLGADRDFNTTTTKSHTWAGNGLWRPGLANVIALVGKGHKDLCGAEIHYAIATRQQ
jgi:hypothetical protein